MRFLLFLAFTFFISTLSAQQSTKKRGTVKVRDEQGRVTAKGKVRNYKKRGEWKYYDQAGNVATRAYFVNDTIHGPYTEYFPTAAVSIQGTYCMNQKCGNWKAYDSNGHLMSIENFDKGLQHGTQQFYYPNGTLRDSLNFDHGVILYREAHYSNGKRKAIEHYKNGLPEGTWTEYDEYIDPSVPLDTFPVFKRSYHNGKLEGWSYEYANRKVKVAAHYKEGRLNGDLFTYNSDGTAKSAERYVNGEKEGMSTYWKNESKILEQNFEKGILHGKQSTYGRNNDVLKATWYDHGNIDSVISYFSNGKVAIRETWNPRAKMYVHEEWNETGMFLVTGFANIYGKRDSVWTSFYPNGKVRSVTHYRNGQLFGLFTKYYDNGKKMIEMNFLSDGRNTQPDVWYSTGKIAPMTTHFYSEMVEGNKAGEFYNDPALFTRSLAEREGKPGDEGLRRND